MRLVVGILLLMFGLGLVSCHWEGPATRAATVARDLRWVRTVDGWERSDTWHVTVARPPGLHPLVLAAGQGLVSLLALAVCPRCAGRNTAE